jgi:hypothetical protein
MRNAVTAHRVFVVGTQRKGRGTSPAESNKTPTRRVVYGDRPGAIVMEVAANSQLFFIVASFIAAHTIRPVPCAALHLEWFQ